jgi:hypothetical protein
MLAAKIHEGPRWPRGQKFAPSTAGLASRETYRATIAEARSMGRTALDAALAAWASPINVAAADGVVLNELSATPRSLPDLTRALEDAGIAPGEVRSALDRLVRAGLVELVPPPSAQAQPPATPPPPRWR